MQVELSAVAITFWSVKAYKELNGFYTNTFCFAIFVDHTYLSLTRTHFHTREEPNERKADYYNLHELLC